MTDQGNRGLGVPDSPAQKGNTRARVGGPRYPARPPDPGWAGPRDPAPLPDPEWAGPGDPAAPRHVVQGPQLRVDVIHSISFVILLTKVNVRDRFRAGVSVLSGRVDWTLKV